MQFLEEYPLLIGADKELGPTLAEVRLQGTAVTCCFIILWSSAEVTAAGIQKQIAQLEDDISKLTAKLPSG
ncbi:MAG: hypothetical protein HYU37_03060 [Acidobacteria bacterium]|nr:hypothetical protein [Acidobacteriota bacterium]